MNRVPKDGEAENVETMTIGKILSEVTPSFMEIMMVPMNGKVAYGIGRSWKMLQKEQQAIYEANSVELKKHVVLDEKGEVKMSTKEGERHMSPDYKTPESKQAYQDWYKGFTEQEWKVPFYPIQSAELANIQNLKPATIAALDYMLQ
jgi:hypothetical protein